MLDDPVTRALRSAVMLVVASAFGATAPADAAVLASAINTAEQTLTGPGPTPVDLRTAAGAQTTVALTTAARRTLLVTFQAACRVDTSGLFTVAGATIQVSVNGGPFQAVSPNGSFASFCVQSYVRPDDLVVNSLSGMVAVPAGTIRFRVSIDITPGDTLPPFVILDDTLLAVEG